MTRRYKVEIRKIIYLQVLDLSGESIQPQRNIWEEPLSKFLHACPEILLQHETQFSNPPRFSQDFLNTPRVHLQNSKSEQAKKVYECVLPSDQIVEKVHPHASRFDDQKNLFSWGKFIKIHIKVPSKKICKWMSLLIPRSLNSKLTVNLKNFTNFHESYKSVTNLFFGKKGSLPFL